MKHLWKSETNLRIWLYLAKRSERHGAPVLICVRKNKQTCSRFYCIQRLCFHFKQRFHFRRRTCPAHKPTTKSAIKVSSVSPERWLTITPQPFSWAFLHLFAQITEYSHIGVWIWRSGQLLLGFWLQTHALKDSVTVPIWLTFSSRQLQAFSSTALPMRVGLVTVRSSPTTWMSVLSVKLVQAAQSSWSKGSSMETTVGLCVGEVNCSHASLDNHRTFWILDPVKMSAAIIRFLLFFNNSWTNESVKQSADKIPLYLWV